MRSDSFSLQGYTYYAEQRTCGKPDCKCASGELHGPYWYKRDQQLGTVKYIGKTLPDEIIQIRAKRALLATAIEEQHKKVDAEINHLREISNALSRLRYNQDLNEAQRRIVRMLGFGDCLVAPRPESRKQEEANS